ncbi:MAG: ABC transporter, permease protein (cluster 3, basic aa/glutamine/opines), partial [uncultured Corynebacteriales bacterium]
DRLGPERAAARARGVPAPADPPVGGRRRGQHAGGGRGRGGGAGRLAGLAAGAGDVLLLGGGAGRVPGGAGRVLAQRADLRGRRGAGARGRAGGGGAAHAARAGVLPGAAAGRGVHGPVPRAAADPGHPAARLRGAGAAAGWGAGRRGGVGHRGAGADLRRVRRRGDPGRHRVGAPQPGRRGPLARALARAVAAVRGAAAGAAPGGAAAAQRRGQPAEGLRAHLGARGDRRGPGGADRDVVLVQLHPLPGGGGAVPAADDPDGPGDRLDQHAGAAPAVGGCPV